MEPSALSMLIGLRAQPDTRVEFIFDTNGLSQGIGHWLASVFADRCDLVHTAVSLRELQDLGDRAGYKKTINFKPWEDTKKGTSGFKVDSEWLEARQCYDAARRFVEFTGLRHPRWRELDLDDTALLLSRGTSKIGDKDSGADSMLLRQVRRAIQDRVRGMERYFVTGDLGLARRAATELPVGSTIFARVRDIHPGAVYFPCDWWPGGDDGASVGGVLGPRLVRELLALGDTLDVVGDNGDGYRFRSWRQEMGLADYARPWMLAEKLGAGWPESLPEPEPVPAQVAVAAEVPPALPAAQPEVAVADAPGPPLPAAQPVSPFEPPPWFAEIQPLDDHLRVRAKLLFEILGLLAAHEGPGPVAIEGGLLVGDQTRDLRQRRAHLRTLLSHLQLGEVDEAGLTIHPGPRHPKLVEAWRQGDRSSVYWLLAPYRALRLASTGDQAFAALPEAIGSSAQAITAKLGFIARIGRDLHPGGATPSIPEIRSAVRAWAEGEPGRPLTVLGLLTEVFLHRLRVSPSRVIDAWDSLRASGVFDGLEFARGLASSGAHVQEVVEFTQAGVQDVRMDIESVRGSRDVVWHEGERR